MYSSTFKLRVTYADTDMMGRVYYSRYLEYFEAARSHMLRELGLPYSEIEKMGLYLPVIESHCVYKTGATFEDTLDIVSTVREIPRSTIRIDYRVTQEGSESVVAEGYTIHGFVNSSGKAMRPPKPLLDALKSNREAAHDR